MVNRAVLAVLAICLAASAVGAQSGNRPHPTTAATPIGTLLADPAARALVARHFPALIRSRPVQSGMANRMTLRSLKRFKPELFTDAALAAIDADFARLQGR